MGEAASFRLPQKILAVVQEIKIVVDVHPGGIAFGHDLFGLAGAGIGQEKGEFGLRAVEHLNPHLLISGQPFYPGDILIIPQLQPGGFPFPRGVNHPDMHGGIFRAGFGVALGNQLRDVGALVDEKHFGNRGFVAAQKGDLPGIAAPPVADVPAPEDLLPVNPGKGPVKQGFSAGFGEARLAAVDQMINVQIVVPHVSQLFAVRRKIERLFLALAFGEAAEQAGFGIEQVDVLFEKVGEVFPIGADGRRPAQALDGIRIRRQQRLQRVEGHLPFNPGCALPLARLKHLQGAFGLGNPVVQQQQVAVFQPLHLRHRRDFGIGVAVNPLHGEFLLSQGGSDKGKGKNEEKCPQGFPR